MSVSSISPAVPDLPTTISQAHVQLQAKMLSVAAAQASQSAPMETLLSVLNVLGIGDNLDVRA